jgi:hypothetical protein
MEVLQQLMRVLPIWPPDSPDLNSIEVLWSVIGRNLVPLDDKTEKDLLAEVQRIRDELDQDMIDRLVKDFWRRCELVKVARGKTLSHLLSLHILVARTHDIGTATSAIFTAEQRNDQWQAFREAYPFAEEFPFGEAMIDVVDADPGDGEPEHEDEIKDGDLGDDAPQREVVGESSSSDEEDEALVESSSSDDDDALPPPSPPSRGPPPRSYLLYCKEHSADANIVGVRQKEQGLRLARLWHDASAAEKAQWEAGAAQQTPKASPPKKGGGRPRKTA